MTKPVTRIHFPAFTWTGVLDPAQSRRDVVQRADELARAIARWKLLRTCAERHYRLKALRHSEHERVMPMHPEVHPTLGKELWACAKCGGTKWATGWTRADGTAAPSDRFAPIAHVPDCGIPPVGRVDRGPQEW